MTRSRILAFYQILKTAENWPVLAIRQGQVPDYLRSDNGSEFTARLVRNWLERVGVKTLFIEPGSPWENGYVESLNGKFRDEFLNGEIFSGISILSFPFTRKPMPATLSCQPQTALASLRWLCGTFWLFLGVAVRVPPAQPASPLTLIRPDHF